MERAPCPVCDGRRDNPGCGDCGGVGTVLVDRDEEDSRGALLAEECSEFLGEWAFVQRHGLALWVELHGRPHPWFIEAMDVMERVIGEEEHAERVRWADGERRKAAAARAGSKR